MRIGIDLGGTKIEGIALGEGGTLLCRRRLATPAGDYPATVRAMAGLVHAIESATGRRGTVGVGAPGALSPVTGKIRNANSTCLIGQALDRDLSAALQRPVRLANDANCFALSEAVDGAAAGAAVVFGVILGTGTGGGLVVDGRVLTGRNAIAGEWGHNPLPWPTADEQPGPPCYCGKRGCIETFLSGPGLERDFAATTAATLAAADIARRAGAGDEQCEAVLQRYEQRLARALATVINVLDPDVIVLGGGLSNVERLYQRVPRLWGRWVFSDHVATPLVPPLHGDSSGVRGAAWLWPQDERAGHG
ncbi:MAG TPA: ROK family protein [Gammaproteobacteria bacterium]|nr:ROK family protein [Gammaproteobacteria bacterium]